MASSQDTWRVSGEDRSKHDAQFFQLKPVNGFVSGAQARDFFVQSGLPTQVLGQIWTLADMNGDGKMDKKEFSIAMHLIKKKLQGYELPKSLPASLKADPMPVIGSLGQPSLVAPMVPQMGMGFSIGGVAIPGPSLVQPQTNLGPAAMPVMSMGLGPHLANGMAANFPRSASTPVPLPGTAALAALTGTSAPSSSGSLWTMPHSSKLKHTQTFNTHDRNKRGHLLGVEARAILMQSGLPQHLLAQIWALSDIDQDGKLTCEEFCIAMHLSELARAGHVLPPTLPLELSPGKSRSSSVTAAPVAFQAPGPQKDTFGDLLSSAGMSLPVSAAPVSQPAGETVHEQVTFEDKRKENFDKGQAELEKRRAVLREQQEKEQRERMEKERQEAEKRERQRQEAESKRQAELQRQLEKQREKEREIEEQRRKMVEQREAARRELERQRQLEWEKTRTEQLLVEKQREYEQLGLLKSQMANLQNELESLSDKKTELAQKISHVQMGVTEYTKNIDFMRVSRDRTMAEIDQLERQTVDLNRKLASLKNEKEALNLQMQTAQESPLSETNRTVASSVETKKAGLHKLKKEIEQLESDTEARLGEIDCNNAELKNLKDQLTKMQRDLPMLQKQQEEKKALQKRMAAEVLEKQKAARERLEKQKPPVVQPKKELTTVVAPKPASKAQSNWLDFNIAEVTNAVAAGDSSINWDSAFSSSKTPSTYGNVPEAWGFNGTEVSAGTGSPQKYRALYDFAATREDELTLVSGMELLVYNDVNPVPGMEDWYKGEHLGKIGWFPKAYVEKLAETSADLFESAFDFVAPLTSASKSEILEQTFTANVSQQQSLYSNTPTTKDTSSAEVASESNHIPREGLLARAMYPWKARQETDLTFDKDEVILVREQQDMRWFGELNGRSGWFPKAYVKLIGVGPKTEQEVEYVSPPASHPPVSDSQDLGAVDPGSGEYYIAIYPYVSAEPADLNFNEGDMIYVTSTLGDWWSGTLGDQGISGIFPANYVKKLDLQVYEPEQKTLKKPEIAQVIAPYVATGTGQLSLEIGNLIHVKQKSPRGWWEGELQARGQKKKIGWFPADYVKLLGGSSLRSTPELGASSTLTVSQGSRAATPQSFTSQDSVVTTNQAETVVALYAYVAQNDDELTFQKDDVITVLSRDNPDWWAGQLNGQTGAFPSNYVTPTPQSQSWMNDTQGKLSKAERKRQQAIQELISTEESYNNDMQIALEVFKKPLLKSTVIPAETVNLMFVNWEELIVCNKKLLQALRVRKKMCGKNGVIDIIGDILCESLPHMTPYMRFCSCQLSAAATLQRVSETVPAFQEFHRACMQNPKVKGVHLSGFMLKPMQRITRYPLLVDKILENTPADHADRGNLEDALTLAQELCSQANQCVKEKQNSDSLEWIQAHVQCDGMAENIVFNSLTNCMGPRRLLFHGILYKVKSNKELVGFLFNDFLMLAYTSKQLAPGFSTVRIFDTALQFKMYRVPIFLNEITVKKSPEENEATHFHITSDRTLSLKAVSAVERDTWVREIDAASRQYKDKARTKLERAHSVRKTNVGRILVVIQEASHLKASDATGKSDPYCEVSMGSQEHRTKVIPGTLNPRWNASMQFSIRDVERDTLCFTVYDRDLYSPNDFLGRTEVKIKDVLVESGERRGPITKRLILHEVETGEVVVKLDLQLFE